MLAPSLLAPLRRFEAHHVTTTGFFDRQRCRAACVDNARCLARPTLGNEDNHDEGRSIAFCSALHGDRRFPFGRAPAGFSTLLAVGVLFSNLWLLLAGWIHCLAFDLLVSSWNYRTRENEIPHWTIVSCPVLTFLFGPAEWLLYTIVRSFRRNGSN